MRSSQRIVTNSVAMYIKMLLSLIVTFFSTRIVLNNLGINDFGIYNLVAGSISLLGFINGSMSNTIQRFLAYELGNGNINRLKKTFSIAFKMHLKVGLLIVITLEFFGLFAFDNFFIIEQSRIEAAKIAFHIMAGVTFISTISSPLIASIYAHEDIILFAIIEFTSSILKLLAAIALFYLPGDKLILYCIFILFIQLIQFSFESIYCRKKYDECKKINILIKDKSLQLEIFPFMGWNMIESFSWLIKNQGISVLMNTFYGTVVNAAYGIGNQVNGQVMYFSSTLMAAIRPQIYKSGGLGEINQMITLSISAAKMTFCMMLLFICPLIFILNDILIIWLKNVPEYTERICILLLIISMFSYMYTAINILVQAYGNVKKYQLASSAVILLCVPIGYIIYSNSSNVYMFLYIMILVELISTIIKYKIAANIFHKKTSFFLKRILLPCMISFILSLLISFILSKFLLLNSNIVNSIIFTILDASIISVLIYFICFTKNERRIITHISNEILHKFKHK